MYSQDGTLLYREKGDTITGSGTNYIYLGKKLIAKYGDVTPQTVNESRQHARPFGESIETPKDDVGYTGHKFDTDLGLSYMQARYYDPVIGRFYSNDPKSSQSFLAVGRIHGFNRYTYAANNPYRYVDPSGEDYEESYISLKIPFIGSLDIGVVHFTKNVGGQGNNTSGAFIRVATSASNVNSDSSSGKLKHEGLLKYKGVIGGLTFGKGRGTHTDENFDDPSASIDVGLLIGAISVGDFSSEESSASSELGISFGADGTIGKSFTLTGNDIKSGLSTVYNRLQHRGNLIKAKLGSAER
ncbi:MAG: RHS repeat-associated core domain-containing protein [Pseudoalteromonas sp.]|nr:RHS repeat-associated core domain-containing protein [Pseudoalteromonas sp.]